MSSISDIGRELVDARRAAGITQAELGVRLGVPQQQIARWERRAYAQVALGRVAQAAAALGADALLTGGAGLAAESPATYGAGAVRDLGGVAARLRAHDRDLRERFGLEGVAVFGSFATGTQQPGSDVDLLASPSPDAQVDVGAFAAWAGSLLGRAADVATPDTLRWEICEDVAREAVAVWHA